MFWPQRLSFPRSNGRDDLGDVRREVGRLGQEVDALRADMRAVQEERGVVVRSVSQSRDSLDVLAGSMTPSAIYNGTCSSSPGASSAIPLESLQHCERPYGASYGASGGAPWTSVRGGSLLSRISSATGRVWNEDRWRYRDESQTSLSAKILLRLSGASCGECCGWHRLVVVWTSAIWLTGYLPFSIAWIVSIMKLQSGPADHCKAAADTLVLFAGLTHWISIICLRPVSSVQGVSVTLAVFLVASGMGIRLLTTLAGFTSSHQHQQFYGRASILPVVLIVSFLLSLAQGAAAVIFQGECSALCKAVNNHCNKSISPGDHSHLHEHAQATKRRWTPFLMLHLMPEFGAIALYTFSGLIEARPHNWLGLVEQSGHVISALMYVLSQVVPLVTYNEAVLQAKLVLEEFASLQRLNRWSSLCVELSENQTLFDFFLIAGITSALSGSIKYHVCLVLGVEH